MLTRFAPSPKPARHFPFAGLLAAMLLACLTTTLMPTPARAQFKSYAPGGGQQQSNSLRPGMRPAAPAGGFKYGGGIVYPEFKNPRGIVHWTPDRMPLKVFVAPGWSLDEFIDDTLGAPVVNVDNVGAWPKFLLETMQKPEQLKDLPIADGYTDQGRQAAMQGILMWKPFEKEGLFSYQLTDDPTEADVFYFWTNHFVNKMGLALFANDIRGLTSKDTFPYKAVLAGGRAEFKPVLILLRTTEGDGSQVTPGKLKASAAHEFGHALGIDGHSTNPIDLMSKFHGKGLISPNDAATIRFMYKHAPDLIP
jgi:hypothetical protein